MVEAMKSTLGSGARMAALVGLLASLMAGASACGSSDATRRAEQADTTAVVTTIVTTEPEATASTAGPAPSPTTTFAPVQPNPRRIDLEDRSRPVVTNGRTVAVTRQLPTLVWLPPGDGPHPLVVFAHGYRVGPLTYARFCAAIAAAGYVVAAPSFPLADQSRGLGLDRDDIPNEARDLSFVIASMRSGALASAIGPGAVGVVGHSDGADVALDLGYVQGLSDPTIGAVVAIAPDAMVLPLSGATPPLLLMHSDADPVVPYSESMQVFGRIGAPRTFVTLLGADHLPPVAESTRWTGVVDGATTAFLDATLKRSLGMSDVRARMDIVGISNVQTAG